MDSLAVVRAIYDCWGAGDLQGAAELVDQDVDFVRIGDALGDLAGEWHGLEATQEAILQWLRAWEELLVTADRLIDLGGGRVLALDRQRGRGRSSSVVLEHELATILTVRGGKITRIEAYWDRADAIGASGLDPTSLED